MKKVKQSKKRWARTEAQGRRDYYANSWASRRYHIPSWFVKSFEDINEGITRKALHDLNREVDPDEVFFETRYRARCSAAWWWL